MKLFTLLLLHFIWTVNKTRGSVGWACVAHLLFNSMQTLYRTIHRSDLPSFGSFGHTVSEKKIIKKSTNQKQKLPVEAMFVNGSGQNEAIYIEDLP